MANTVLSRLAWLEQQVRRLILRLSVAGGGLPPSAHATTHSDGGSDPVDVTTLAGFPGGSPLTYLDSDGNFSTPSVGGDVFGPSSSTDNAFARFDGTTGKLLQDSSGATLDDSGRAVFKTIRIPLFDAGNSGTSKTLDFNDSNEQLLTLTGNVTLTLSNPTDGGRYVIVLAQDGTGGRTVAWPAAVKWPAGTTPTITATASKYDLITLIYLSGAGIYLASINQNYSG